MKKGLIASFVSLLMIKLVSAQFYSGYGGSFSITSFLDRIGSENVIFVTLFIIFFAVLFYALSRVFKDSYGQPNKPIAGVLAFAISALISYGIYRSNFDLASLFYGWGIDNSILYPIISVAVLLMAGLTIKYLGIGISLILFGFSLFYIAFFTDLVYEKTFLGIIGGIAFVLGVFIWKRKSAKRLGGYALGKVKAKPKWVIILAGILMIFAGFNFGIEILIYLGILVILIGFFFKRTRRGVPPYAGPSGGSPSFAYQQGMRRGGEKPARNRFVSRRAVERYARRFGRGAAERRFGR